MHTLRREIGTAVAICCMALLMVIPKVRRHAERLPAEMQAAAAHGLLQITARTDAEPATDLDAPARALGTRTMSRLARTERSRAQSPGGAQRHGPVPLRL